jgi:hypothetical protein
MLDAAQRALDLFQHAWGAFPFAALRLVEVPAGFPAAAFATPGVVFLTEDHGFLTDARDSAEFDLVTRRVAHEVAHMWWGNHVRPAGVKGAMTIVETLAKYGEQMVLRDRWGEAMLAPLLQVDADRYRTGVARSAEPERALYRATDQDFLYYGKGGVVMHALRDSIGGDLLNEALRQFAADHGGANAPPPTNSICWRRSTTSRQHGVALQFSRPGKPVDNTFIEAFNGRLRDECLNQSWFVSLRDAQRIIERWRHTYNTERPPRSLDGRTPASFAAAWQVLNPTPTVS